MVVMWNIVRQPVMRNIQDMPIQHTNAEGDCYSGSVQRVTLLLFKRYFFVWINSVSQYAIVTELFRRSRHNREWTTPSQNKSTDQNESSGPAYKSRGLENLQGKSLACSPEGSEVVVISRNKQKYQSWKINTWTLEYYLKSMEVFANGPLFECVSVCMCMCMPLTMPAISEIGNIEFPFTLDFEITFKPDVEL